jgi:hypothetical protein
MPCRNNRRTPLHWKANKKLVIQWATYRKNKKNEVVKKDVARSQGIGSTRIDLYRRIVSIKDI